MEQEFSEFSKFREFDKLLKHKLGSIKRSYLSHVSCWHCGSILVLRTRVARLKSSTVMTNIFVTKKHLMKTQLIPKFEKRALKILKCSMLTVIVNS